jgi:hypothetical protein
VIHDTRAVVICSPPSPYENEGMKVNACCTDGHDLGLSLCNASLLSYVVMFICLTTLHYTSVVSNLVRAYSGVTRTHRTGYVKLKETSYFVINTEQSGPDLKLVTGDPVARICNFVNRSESH